MNRFTSLLLSISIVIFPCLVLADADDMPTANAGTGWFGTLNPKSKYYSDFFPEPFRVEDTTIDNEFRFDWQHNERHGSVGDFVDAELQKSFGIVTFEIQAPYVSTSGGGGEADDTVNATGRGAHGFGAVELGARVPLLQNVWRSGFFDNTIGFNLNVGVPTNSPVGKNAEVAPGLFDDLAIGDHFSVQSLFTLSHQFGAVTTGRDTFEYGLAFGYAIEDEDFKIPHVERLVPSVELVGNTLLDRTRAAQNALTGTVGCRVEFKSVRKIQPTFGVGYVFPIDRGGREELRWGVITSLTLEFP